MKFCAVVFELERLQNLCYTQTDIFQKLLNCLQDILKCVNLLKTEIRKFSGFQCFLLMNIKVHTHTYTQKSINCGIDRF